MNDALAFEKVDILFTRQRGRRRAAGLKAALASLDAGRNRAEIAAENGVVVGIADASLKIERGKLSVLMGLSGSGKSTLLRAANGLNAIARGRVMVDDGGKAVDVASCDTATLRRLRRGRIAMIFQQFGLLPWRTVRENVGFGLELRGDPPDRRRRVVDEKLELVGLSQWADSFVSELSGGMQQRVGLARAFATDADILLMDEPFSSLDALIRSKLQDELCVLHQQLRKTILFVTHDLNEALKLGDQISVLEAGRIVQTGSPEEIVLRPANDYVAEFVQHMNPLAILNGRMVMRQRQELRRGADSLWLDDAESYRLILGARDEPLRVVHGGVDLPLCGSEGAGLTGVAVAAAETPLRRLIQLQQDTGHPVLLTEGSSFCGICGAPEVIRALARSDDVQAGEAKNRQSARAQPIA